MKYVILGGVAAGTKAAAKLKRLDRQAEVKIFTKSADISYAGCGLPYYIGGDISERRIDCQFAGKVCGSDRRAGIHRM